MDDLRDYISIGRKWLWLFVLATIVATVSAWVATRFMPRMYRSQTTVMVGRATNDPNPNFQDLYLGRSLAETYAQMVTREPIMAAVVEALQLNGTWQSLKSRVKATAVAGTQLVEIQVLDTIPNRAQAIADEVAHQLIDKSPTPTERDKIENQAFVQSQRGKLRTQIEAADREIAEMDAKINLESSARAISDLQSRKSARLSQVETWRQQYSMMLSAVEGGEVNSLAVIEKAAPGTLVGPNAKMNILLAALIGLGLALGAVLGIEYLDNTLKTVEHVEKRLDIPGLATVDRLPEVRQRKDGLITVLSPRSPTAEAFRTLRTNLQFSLLHQPHDTLLVTSANPGEGKSTVTSNLGVVCAQAGSRVVLVDADLRRPSLHRFFGLPNSLGMTSLLLDPGLTIQDALQPVDGVPGLSILTSGPLPPNPAEILGSPRMADLLDRLRAHCDVAVVDSPPLLVVTDAAVLSTRVGGTVLVLDSGNTRTDAARKAVDVLAKVGVKPLGGVVNNLDPRTLRGYYYADRYRYNYGDYYGSSDDGDTKGSGTPPATGARPRPRPAAGWMARVRQVMTSLLS